MTLAAKAGGLGPDLGESHAALCTLRDRLLQPSPLEESAVSVSYDGHQEELQVRVVVFCESSE